MRLLILLLPFLFSVTRTTDEGSAPAEVDEMVEAVLASFEQVDVVALGESHGSGLDSEFRIALVKHPDFLRTVDVIVIEFANAHRQDVLDRFVSGERVTRDELVRIWRDTGYDTWESPIYEEFLTAVREVNAAARADRRLKVIAGDAPIAWDDIDTPRELYEFMDRGDYPTHIVDCEILAKGRKGLLIYGSLHLIHGRGDSFVAALDRKYPGRVRTVVGVHWPDESLDRLRSALDLGSRAQLISLPGTAVDDWDFFEVQGMMMGDPGLSLAEAIDGLLYYGDARDRIVAPDSSVFDDPDFRALRERQRRIREEFRAILRREGWGAMRQWDDYTCR